MIGGFRVRFRFRIRKPLNIPTKKHLLRIDERDVMLSGQTPTSGISDNSWLVMNASGFETEQKANEFGGQLKAACELSSAAAKLGIDARVDRMTSGLGSIVKDYARKQYGILLRDDIHGVDIFKDDSNIQFGIHWIRESAYTPGPISSGSERILQTGGSNFSGNTRRRPAIELCPPTARTCCSDRFRIFSGRDAGPKRKMDT